MLQTIEFLAVISGGIYGVLLARRKGLDFVGVFCVAFITALGGGTLRDILLDRRPLFWLRAAHFPLIIFGLAVAATVTRRWVRWPKSAERWLSVPDALGLGLFSIGQHNLVCGDLIWRDHGEFRRGDRRRCLQ
jgi:uncharacterized membrane protein YeiH